MNLEEWFCVMKTIDSIQIGDSASFTKTVTETDIILYAGLTGDFNPAHIDSEHAKGSMFGQRIAHGMLSAGLCWAPSCLAPEPSIWAKSCALLSLFMWGTRLPPP